ncbi:MAG: hypothetical protein GC156_15740 [Actinomycetales bacterium]|nr:hypothetical protein [Actinomycetales bacterium]
MDTCLLNDAAFDVASSAGWYSAVAGLLAGFAFVAVLLPLDHDSDQQDERQTAHAVVVFVCAFFSLLILSLTYAILAGRTAGGSVDGVAAHEQMINGAAFGLSVLLLMFGLRAVLGAYGRNRHVFDAARGLVLVVTSVIGPAVVLALQFSNALDVERYRTEAGGGEACNVNGMPTGVWLNLSITVGAFVVIVALALFRERLPRYEMAPEWIAKIVLGFTVLFVAWSSIVVPLLPPAVVTSALFEHLAVALTAALTVAFSLASWLGR